MPPDRAQQLTAKELLLHFCRSTSLRGIPRIVSADSRLLQGLWLLFVSGLVLACALNLQQIVTLYLAYDVVQMPVHEVRQDAAFPSITVCNQIPLSPQGRRSVAEKRWRSPRQFWKALRTARGTISRMNFTRVQRQWLRIYMSGFFSLNGYFSNIPFGHSASSLGQSKEDLIRSCYLLVRNLDSKEPPVRSPSCEQLGTWRLVHDQNRLNCYTFSVNSGVRDPVIEMEMRLFLGHDPGSSCADCITIDMNTQIMGARVVLHENGTFPDVSKEGFNVYPGTLTEVRFSTNNWTRLEPPYGDCERFDPPPVRILGHDFAYSKDACAKMHQQHGIESSCGCTFSFLPHSRFNQSEFCERLDNDFNNFTAKGLVKATMLSRCGLLGTFGKVEGCPQPCHYFTFDTSTTQALWPRESMQLHLFCTELWNRTGVCRRMGAPNRRIDVVDEEVARLYARVANSSSAAAASELLANTSLIAKSFLTLKVTRKDFTVVQIRDKPVRTLASTLSQIGGLLSMWIGLTLIWIVELLELLIRLAWRLQFTIRRRRSGKDGPSMEDTFVSNRIPLVLRTPQRSLGEAPDANG